MEQYSSPLAMLSARRPEFPVTCFRPHAIDRAVKTFLQGFPGTVLFAVKTNPAPHVLDALYRAGIRHFDAASIPEIARVAERFDDATIYYMHPIKSPESIARAYFDYGVRHFSLDSIEELEKIVIATNGADDLCLHVRLAIANSHSEHDLSGKFGVQPAEALPLLRRSRAVASHLGICFHVGSQCMDPDAYRVAIRTAADLAQTAGVTVDSLDCGGGFPSRYPELTPPPIAQYFAAIREEVSRHAIFANARLMAEPGRALVAESTSVVVRVEARRGQTLYINDGTYGSLFDAGHPELVFPVKAMRTTDDEGTEALLPFSFYGPTCDSLDFMRGPFMLPADIQAGEYIEIGQLGSYGAAMRTDFNGFYHDDNVEVANEPVLSHYAAAAVVAKPNRTVVPLRRIAQ